MKIPSRARLAALLAAALVCARAGAQETERWFSSAREAAPYAALAGRISELARELVSGGVPERLLLDRLVEGARKRAAPERLLAAMEERL